MSELRLATRRSPLALVQASSVQRRLSEFGVTCVLVPLETRGDHHAQVSLDQLGAQGVFAVEVQLAVLNGDADVAIHSAKDLPSTTPDGLSLTCVPERLDAADVLIGRSLAGLGPGATVATGSPRRRALLLERRPDLRVVGLRGNMATRFAAAGQSDVDAVVVAAAALERLGRMTSPPNASTPSGSCPRSAKALSRSRSETTMTRRSSCCRRSTSLTP